jgi:fatty acid desaturase
MELRAAKPSRVVPRSFCRDERDALRHMRTSRSHLLLMYALLAASLLGWAPVWLLVVFVPPLYVRCALSAHELMHACKATQVSLLHRLMMVLETPVCLGYREHRDIHMRHHRDPGTERDPEFFQIRGGHVRAALSAMVSPEWSLWRYLRERGASREFLAEAALRCAVFVAAAAANPLVFLWYWITLRASVGGAAYLFHHALHYRAGRYGTFPLRPSRPLERILRLVLGRECVLILLEHPAHHAFQQVKASHLPDVASGALASGVRIPALAS